mmetsp:Transcript_25363/g.50542  ORF Transcript_25363/g.50542 Transcript_25363/m.50542 type:complete len:225 (-) Transcript_25363:106-780(-)
MERMSPMGWRADGESEGGGVSPARCGGEESTAGFGHDTGVGSATAGIGGDGRITIVGSKLTTTGGGTPGAGESARAPASPLAGTNEAPMTPLESVPLISMPSFAPAASSGIAGITTGPMVGFQMSGRQYGGGGAGVGRGTASGAARSGKSSSVTALASSCGPTRTTSSDGGRGVVRAPAAISIRTVLLSVYRRRAGVLGLLLRYYCNFGYFGRRCWSPYYALRP